jgi:hypothetical protein
MAAISTPAAPNRANPWLAPGLVLATVLLALALACGEFQSQLNSDLLWPQVFLHDLHDPLHPVSGWTFGSAPFWFPDYAILLPLYWLCGNSGLEYPLYTVVIYLITGAAMAWALAAAGLERRRAVIAAFLCVNLVLLTQFIGGHAGWLWLLGIPCDHGTNVANGFALLALVLGALHAGKWSRVRSVATIVLLTLGLASNTLLLVHWLAPIGLALAGVSWRTQSSRPILTGLLWRAALAFALSLAQRIVLALAQVFFFSKLLQYPPTPNYVWESFSHFVDNFFAGGVFTEHWLLWLVGAAGIAIAVDGLRPAREADPVKRVALLAGLLSLLAAWAAPIATVYWVNPTSIRYLLNWLMLPAWMIALRFCGKPAAPRWLPRLAAVVTVLGIALSLPRISTDKMFFPQPPEAETLREFCERHDLHEGLADFWHTHLLTVEWRFSGPRLGNIANDLIPCFWCNNAFDYFPPAENGHGLAPPAPQFIILDGLDPQRVAPWVGGDTLKVTQVGPYTIALLTPGQTKRAGELLTMQTMFLLQGRRADWLKTQLPPGSGR